MIRRLFHIWRLKAELEANLARRKIARQFRSLAAKQGQSTEIRNRKKRCQQVFGR